MLNRNSVDLCPGVSGPAENGGCPDEDVPDCGVGLTAFGLALTAAGIILGMAAFMATGPAAILGLGGAAILLEWLGLGVDLVCLLALIF